MKEEGFYLIWSEEHGAWWMHAKRGYTRSLVKAGIYSKSEAEEICKKANQYLVPGLDGPFNEIAIPDPRDE